MKPFTVSLSLLMFALAIPPLNCFGKPPLSPDPKFLAIDQIVLLPVLDARAGKKENINLEKYLRGTAQKNLKSKNYQVILNDSFGNADQIVEEDLSDAKPDWIKRLGPSEARWVMIVGIRDVHSKTTFGSTGNAEVFGFLYDKENGVVWKGIGTGQVGQGGLLGMALKGVMSASAIQIATANLLGSLPKLPKNKHAK